MLWVLSVLSISTGLKLDQAYYSSSWQGEEKNFLSWGVYLNLDGSSSRGVFEVGERVRMEYGKMYMEGEEPGVTADKLEGELVGKLGMGWAVDPYLSLRTLTSFTRDSLIFNPVEFFQSCGLGRGFFSKSLNLRLGFTLRQTLDRKENDVPLDGGLEIFGGFVKEISRMLTIRSEIRVFKVLFSSEESEERKSPDLNFLTILSLKPWKYLEINLNIEAKYDKEEVDELQLKETLSFGFSLNL